MTFKSYLYKETLSLSRTYKLLIIGIISLVFAFTTPVITYFLPKILESQINGEIDFSAYITSNQTIAIQSFLGDIYEIVGLIIIVFSSKLIISEFKSKSIVIPFTIGLDLKQMVLSKYAIYILYTNSIVLISIVINYIYSGVVFNESSSVVAMVANSAIGLLMFINFHVALVILLSTFTRSSFVVVSSALFSYYLLPGIIGLFPSIRVGPHLLLQSLTLMSMTKNYLLSIIITFLGIVTMLGLSMILIMRVELD